MSPLLFIGIGLLALGNILHIVGVATPHWAEMEDSSKDQISQQASFRPELSLIPTDLGIFKYCRLDEECFDMDKPSSALEAVRAFCVIGILLAFAAIGVAVLFIVLQNLQKNKLVPFGILLAGLAACGSVLLGIIIYAAEVHDSTVSDHFDFAYSFALCIVGGLGIGAGGVLSFFGARASMS